MEPYKPDNITYYISKGPAASNTYLYNNGIECCTLTYDYSFEALYFKYINNDWLVISLGSRTERNDIALINTNEMKSIFIKAINYTIKNITGYSGISDKYLEIINKISSF